MSVARAVASHPQAPVVTPDGIELFYNVRMIAQHRKEAARSSLYTLPLGLDPQQLDMYRNTIEQHVMAWQDCSAMLRMESLWPLLGAKRLGWSLIHKWQCSSQQDSQTSE